ncbi:NADH:ubiquinone oxidoreductase subunit J [Pilimelia terevasa]|uniref:NADH-quinone oxidoreductase subunit J n=1 Tax=Pilimelia terevasa TaxID=53372 RepID=A0A8J3FHF3_9ACTN|nr:NADH-quinone oxidoreductase subunit J [Pilimelia terevasa]GGK21084.1 NADH:ubiquinone oxidoreductase subunit J [Pilimelia terevasa]
MTSGVVLAAAGQMSGGELAAFWVLAPLALLGAIGMVTSRNAVHSALWLVLTMLCLGVFYVIQAGPFIGVAQVIVYTGAIMMLFLFVLMLIGRDASDSLIETLRGQRTAALILGIGFAGLVGTGVYRALKGGPEAVNFTQEATNTNVQAVAREIFTKYVFAFEATSALLITAAIGAMVLAHVERAKEDKPNQPDLMRARFRLGAGHPGAKAGPGVYATSDSVATPARLPDGTLTDASVPEIMPIRELTAAESAPKGTDEK